MTDKELYNHFKTRRHTLDENPGDALWNSITEKMDSKRTPKGKGLVFLILSGIAAVGLTIYMIIPQSVNSLPHQQPNLPKQSIVVIDSDSANASTNKTTVTEREIATEQIAESETLASINTPSVPSKSKTQKTTDTKSSVLKSNSLTPKDTVINTPKLSEILHTTQAQFNNLQKIVFKSELDTVRPSGIKLFTQKYNGRILVQVKEKITQAQFDSLVSASFNTYKKEYNTLLIVRAPGLTPYRERITKYTPTPGMDTISTVKAGYVEFRPIYKKQLDTLIENEALIKSGDVSNNNETVMQSYNLGNLKILEKDIVDKIIIPDNLPVGIYKVYTLLHIDTDGSISNIKIVKKAGYGIDEAVIEAVKKVKTKFQPIGTDIIPPGLSFQIPVTITIR